ncbi:MAG: phosphopantothenoylcysteine decarboxylase [Phycisphaerae bacterium]|jgi:phosphopantothenoylcysteine decarboxylase/phosphopantothenate--cysteine ligase
MRILITAGPTREYFDTVRFISNASTGKMGYAIAEAAVGRGHEVVLVSGPVQLLPPEGVKMLPVISASDMFEAVTSQFGWCQCLIMTAAVCDYRPADRKTRKLEKQSAARTVELLPTEDILVHLGEVKESRVVVGFAMEDHDHRERAEAKLHRKHCDAIVLNDLGNVGTETGTIEILRADAGWLDPVSGTKTVLAGAVLDVAEALVGKSTV